MHGFDFDREIATLKFIFVIEALIFAVSKETEQLLTNLLLFLFSIFREKKKCFARTTIIIITATTTITTMIYKRAGQRAVS